MQKPQIHTRIQISKRFISRICNTLGEEKRETSKHWIVLFLLAEVLFLFVWGFAGGWGWGERNAWKEKRKPDNVFKKALTWLQNLSFAPSNQVVLRDGARLCKAPYFPAQSKWLASCAQKGWKIFFCDLSAAESLGFQRKWRPPAPHRKQSSSRP